MVKLLYSVFEACWRRAFGSGNFNRAILHVINVVATTCLLKYLGYSLLNSVAATAVLEFFYWSVGHGPAFDMGRDKEPSEEIIKRYKKYFWNKWCEKLIPEEKWYKFRYDFLWMFFRYEIPAVIIALILRSPIFLLTGLSVSCIYALCWWLHDEGYLKKLAATELAEIVVGFITGVLLCL